MIHSRNPRANGVSLALLATFLLAHVTPAAAATYDEGSAAQDELSNDRLKPTTWALDAASPHVAPDGTVSFSNVLKGSLWRRGPNFDPDRDYVHVIVPEGMLWVGLRVGSNTTVGSSRSFIGAVAGTTMPVPPTAPNAAGLMGWYLYGLEDRGTDILPIMATPTFGSSGFQAPLPSGDYTVWIQELAVGRFNYEFDFVLAQVPEPGTVALGVSGLALVAAAVRRRRRDESRTTLSSLSVSGSHRAST